MKALILAAGFGTRLLPHTEILPKPLFKIDNTPLIERIINNLILSGADEIFINTHHLADKIEEYIHSKNFDVPVKLIHEPEILNTGGAVLNIMPFLENHDLMVVNSDIYTDICFKTIYDFHVQNKNSATLCLCSSRFNNVHIKNKKIIKFSKSFSEEAFTFTGIQVISPDLIDFFKKGKSSIDAYKKMISHNIIVSPFVMDEKYLWDDLGTIDSFVKNNLEIIMKKTGIIDPENYSTQALAGDGSDRTWMRIKDNNNSIICVYHKLDPPNGDKEAKSFINLGRHLNEKKLPVPKIYSSDYFSGIAAVEDLGDLRLQDFLGDKNEIEKKEICQKIISLLFDFSINGIKGFKDEMAWQTSSYNEELSMWECTYFKEEFLENYSGFKVETDKIKKEFKFISENAVKSSFTGLMHRDFQSRNIMVKNNEFYFIDYQGARKGPLEYDLASFILDPYMGLSPDLRDDLVDFSKKAASANNFDEDIFNKALYFCSLSRNMQILGAFSFLSMKKKKKYFETYIPAAVNSLLNLIKKYDYKEIEYINYLISKIQRG